VRIDLECAPHGGRSLAHAEETKAALSFLTGRVTVRVEANAVVRDGQLNQVAKLPQADGNVAGAGVLFDIPQGLLEDPVKGGLNRGGQAGDSPHALQVDPHGRALGEQLARHAQHREQTQIIQRARPQILGDAPHFFRRPVEQIAEFQQLGPGARAPAGSVLARVSQRIRMA
jgi:hypothetical protein